LAAGSLVEVEEVECCGGGHHGHGEAHGHEPGHECGCSSSNGETATSGCSCSHH
jgi:hypothetical protein